jgi:hypothetical protein
MNTENTANIYSQKTPLQTKTAFALYLNQAIHNAYIAFNSAITEKGKAASNYKSLDDLERVITESHMQQLQSRYFPFLRPDKTDWEKKKGILFKLLRKLDELRNFHSHYYHYTTPFFLNDDELKQYLEEKFAQACDGLLNMYKPEELAHIDISDEYFCFFRELTEADYKYCFAYNQKAMLFLATFFLDKRQANLLISKTKGFKKAFDKPSQATRDAFTYFCMKNDSNFVSQDTSVRFFMDAISHLSKMPQELIGNLNDNALQLKITANTLYRIKALIFPTLPIKPKDRENIIQQKETFDTLKEIEGKEFLSEKEFLDEVEKRIGHLNTKAYRHIILEHAQETFKIRTGRDRFTHFALQFIDDFNLLPNIRFKVYTGRETHVKETKVYHSKKTFEREVVKRETIYAKMNDRRPQDVIDDLQYQYVIRNNNVFFEYRKGDDVYRGSMSVHELRNLVFALKNKNKEVVEDKILSYLQQYRHCYTNILSGQSKAEIKKQLTIDEKYLPEYLQNWLNSQKYTFDHFKDAIINKLKYTVDYANTFQKEESNTYYKNLRKHDKIKEILLFVNHNVSKYIDQEQYQKLEIYLGTFPNYQTELLAYLKENVIDARCITNKTDYTFHAIVKDSADIDTILGKTLNATIQWGTETQKKVLASADPEYLKTIAKMINVSPKEYTNERITENINKFLKDNIILPRGFILREFFQTERENENISYKINKRLGNLKLCAFYDKVLDYKNDKAKYKEFGKVIEDIKTKDKILLLMAKEYLETYIAPSGKAHTIEIETDVENVLNKEITILKYGKILKFGIKEYDDILPVLNDKRLEKILSNYFTREQKTIYYIDRNKYLISKDSKTGYRPICDLQDALQTIEREQIEIVDAVLKLEKSVLVNHIGSSVRAKQEDIENFLDKGWHRNLTEDQLNAINATIEPLLNEISPKNDPKEKNRIETRRLLALKGISDDEVKDIIEYRNAAFHNGLPDKGKFADGLGILAQID